MSGSIELLTSSKYKRNTLGIYIHIPFCRSKCPYCDFYSVLLKGTINRENLDNDNSDCTVDISDSQDCSGNLSDSSDNVHNISERYVNALLAEIDDFFENSYRYEIIDTIYFGGGTPSLLSSDSLNIILKKITDKLVNSNEGDCSKKEATPHQTEHVAEPYITDRLLKDMEITIEVNPKDITFEKLRELKGMGFNRLSLGMQSFDDDVLKKLGRRHRRTDNTEAFEMARKAGFSNISVDLMFGIPGQSYEAWKLSVEETVKLKPEHISLYSLEFMDGTKYTRMLDEGKIRETEAEVDRKMYHTALYIFEKNGFNQYEISNMAKPGFESRHNMKYWNLDEYIGFGASAHSYIGNKRFSNVADIELYIDNPLDRLIYEDNTIFDDMSEYVFTGLRKNEGIALNDFSLRFGMDFWVVFDSSRAPFMDYVKKGYAEVSDERIRLTLRGFDISNKIMCLFV